MTLPHHRWGPKQRELAFSGFQHRVHLLLYEEDKLLLGCIVSLVFIPFHQTPCFTETSSCIPWGLACTRLSELWESGFPRNLCSAGNPGPESNHQAKWVNTRVVLKIGSQKSESALHQLTHHYSPAGRSALLLKPSDCFCFAFYHSGIYNKINVYYLSGKPHMTVLWSAAFQVIKTSRNNWNIDK